jgi:hypothetical protein
LNQDDIRGELPKGLSSSVFFFDVSTGTLEVSGMKVLEDFEPGYVGFYCPGCKCHHRIPVTVGARSEKTWGWNGSYEKPTFDPSLNITYKRYKVQTRERVRAFRETMGRDPTEAEIPYDNNAVCHLWVKMGRLEYLQDCTHQYVNQTIDMVPPD